MKYIQILIRWWNILLYAGVGCGAIYLGRIILPANFRDKMERPDNLLLFCGLGFFLLVCLHRIVGFRFGQLKSFFSYPSFLLAPILSWSAIGVIIYIFELSDSSLLVPQILFVITIYFATLIFAGCMHLFSALAFPQREENDNDQRKDAVGKTKLQDFSAPEIIKWAESESPIELPESDLLDFRHRASRILSFLTREDRNSVAILGHYGSGKTSLSNLITRIARPKTSQKLKFVSVSCWGFNDADAAQKTVLNSIVKRLSEETDCFAIAGMPARFVESLSKTSDYADSVMHYVSPRDPDAQLNQLTPILQAQNSRLVVVIEDTERRGSQFDLASIEGLLNRFRDNKHISFVINASPDSEIDFMRLCEHVEFIPELKDEITLTILDNVREFCRNKFPQDIDLVDRKPFYINQPWLGANKYGMWEFELAKLVNTPRKLKATIRRFTNAWESLHGEVDVDELLIASCLRVCAPPVFGFLMRRNSDFPLLEEKQTGKPEKEPPPLVSILKKEWAEIDGQGFDLVAAGKLLQVLAVTQIQALFDEHIYTRTHLVQEFSGRNVYRERIFNETIVDDGMRDQEFLHKIVNAKGDFKDVARTIVESSDFRNIFNHFRSYLVGTKLQKEDIRHIIIEMFAVFRETQGIKASEDCDGFYDAIHWSNTCFDDLNQMLETAFEEVLKCLPANLQLAAAIYHYLIVEKTGEVQSRVYGSRLIDHLKKLFCKGDPKAMANFLDKENPRTLNTLLGCIRDFKKWDWLGPILLAGMTSNPDKYIPEVAVILGLPFVAHDAPEEFLLNENKLNDIFTVKAKDVMVLLSKDFIFPPNISHPERGLDFSMVKIRAQKWLMKQS